jgi:ATP-dependent Clp endopeptidase proteolytic subunit ClpP
MVATPNLANLSEEEVAGGFAFNLRGDATSDTIEIDVFDNVGGGWLFGGITAKDIRRTLRANRTAKSIEVSINSSGGDVFEGLSIYEQLVDHPGKVKVRVSALAASIASVIAMAGDEIEIAQPGFVMIHRVSGGGRGDAGFIRSIADAMEKAEGAIIDIYAARTGQPREEIQKWMNAETYMTSAEAKERGFVDRIAPVKGKQKLSNQKAFAMLNMAGLSSVPDALRSAIDDARLLAVDPVVPPQSDQTPPPGGAAENNPGTGEENNMTDFKAIAVALGLENRSEASIEGAILAEVASLKNKISASAPALALVAKVEIATGKSGDEALGVLQAWKSSHEQLPTVQTENAKLKADNEKAALDKLIDDGRSGAGFEDNKPRLTKAMADKMREQVTSGVLPLASAKAFVETLPPVAHLDPVERPGTKPVTATGPNGLLHNGKSYEQLVPDDLADLRSSSAEGEAQYQNMRADWISRGRPKARTAA